MRASPASSGQVTASSKGTGEKEVAVRGRVYRKGPDVALLLLPLLDGTGSHGGREREGGEQRESARSKSLTL